ncbi:MAG: hypothetical protein ACRYFX_09380 [Janthinobacterium lividum]
MATCTRPNALTAISAVSCAVHFDQIVALLIQRGQSTPSFATEAVMKTLAAWTPLIAAPDGTKVIKTPEFAAFVVPGSEAQFADENSNNSVDGNGYFTGYNSVKAKGEFIGLPSDVRTQLALIEDESRPGLSPGTTAYLVLRDGRLVYSKDAAGNIGGIPFTNFNVSSLDLQGLKTLNKNAFGLTLDGTWDKTIQVVQPSFNPRTQL